MTYLPAETRYDKMPYRRTGLDYFDIFYSHRPDPNTPFYFFWPHRPGCLMPLNKLSGSTVRQLFYGGSNLNDFAKRSCKSCP